MFGRHKNGKRFSKLNPPNRISPIPFLILSCSSNSPSKFPFFSLNISLLLFSMSLPSIFAPSSHFPLPISHFKPSRHCRASIFLSIDYRCCKSIYASSRSISIRSPRICASSSDGASASVPSDSDNTSRLVFRV